MRPIFLVLLCLLRPASLATKEKPPTAYSISLPPKPDFAALDWLVGEWTGKTLEGGAPGVLRLWVSYDLDKRFMIWREQISFAPTKTTPASSETWMGVLGASPSGSGFILRSFSTRGFVIRYRVNAEGTGVYFNPEGGEQSPPGWLFRRVIQRLDGAQFNETVQVAPANKPFFDYYTAKLTRVTPTKAVTSNQ